MGPSPGDDLRLNDPLRQAAFHRALMQQELGPNGAAHYQGLLKGVRRAFGATAAAAIAAKMQASEND
jgi:hypothetical protein